jgi:hypothetical protein
MEISGEIHAPAVLLPGKEQTVPTEYDVDGPQSQFGCDDEEKISHHCPCREFNPGRPALSLVGKIKNSYVNIVQLS